MRLLDFFKRKRVFETKPEEPTEYGLGKKERKEFAQMIQVWHDEIKPKYIFVTDTSATPWAYLIKEAWKTAYHEEKVPKFYRVDPRCITHTQSSEEKCRRWGQFVKTRIKDRDARVLVWDETSASDTGSVARVKHALSKGLPNSSTPKYDEENIFVPRENVFVYGGLNNGEFYEDRLYGRYNVTERDSEGKDYYGENLPNDKTFRAGTIKSKARRNEALSVIHDLKKIGRSIGNQIQKPEESQSLEQKVGATTAIIGLLGSILFLSSNFTGNAIGNVSRSSANWIGAVLFLVGIAGGLFYFRRKFSKRTR